MIRTLLRGVGGTTLTLGLLCVFLSSAFAGQPMSLRGGSNQEVGKMLDDGTVRNASNQKIGAIEANGTVKNASNQKIGMAAGVKKEWAAAFFFFFFN